MRAAILTLAALLGVGSAPSTAEIYRWTDESGKLHFTQSLDQVPPDQRAAARAGASDSAPARVQRFSAGPEPASPAPASAPRRAGTLSVPFERHGTLMLVNVMLNDSVQAPFFVDTGASGVSLPRGVADRLGLRIGASTPHVRVATANGVTSMPLVKLDSVQLAGARVENLEAHVNPSMEVGLLGGAFFNHFVYSIDAAAGVIALRENPGIRGGARADEWRERFRRIRQPLERLESYLETVDVSRPGRRAELEARREELQSSLEELEIEANRLRVPESWRE